MQVEVYKTDGKKANKKVSLNKDVFGIEPNDHAIYLDVKQHLANKRQGTHQSKERGEIVGSTRKIKKQKGTGTARAGSIKSPLFKGGGRVFGPKPRYYGFKLNKKVKQLARLSALSYKAKDENIIVLDEVKMDVPKTKQYSAMLANLKVADGKTLLVLPEADKNIYLAARNLEKASITTAAQLNTYDILHAKNLLLAEASIAEIEKLLS